MFPSGEQEFFAQKGFTNEPTRCQDCRARVGLIGVVAPGATLCGLAAVEAIVQVAVVGARSAGARDVLRDLLHLREQGPGAVPTAG